MVLTRRDVVRMGLGFGGALALGRRAPAASDFHLGLVTYNVAKDWDLDDAPAPRPRGRARGRRVPDDPRPRRRAVARRGQPDGGEEEVRGRRPAADEPGLGLRVPLARPGGGAKERRGLPRVGPPREGRRRRGASRCGPTGCRRTCPRRRRSSQIGRALAECGAFASDHGVEIWVEVHGDQTRVPARMRRIMDVCSHPSVGLTWNSNDTDVAHGSVAASFALLRPFVRCCHITDLRNAYPWRELFALLDQSGF